MKKKWLFLVVALLLIGSGLYYYVLAKNKTKHNDRGSQTVQAHVGSIEDTVEATGEVMPLNRVEIKPPIGGRIEKLLVDEGAHVSSGQILGWMSSTDRAAILDAARAQGPEELKHWEDTYKPTPIVAPTLTARPKPTPRTRRSPPDFSVPMGKLPVTANYRQ